MFSGTVLILSPKRNKKLIILTEDVTQLLDMCGGIVLWNYRR